MQFLLNFILICYLFSFCFLLLSYFLYTVAILWTIYFYIPLFLLLMFFTYFNIFKSIFIFFIIYIVYFTSIYYVISLCSFYLSIIIEILYEYRKLRVPVFPPKTNSPEMNVVSQQIHAYLLYFYSFTLCLEQISEN